MVCGSDPDRGIVRIFQKQLQPIFGMKNLACTCRQSVYLNPGTAEFQTADLSLCQLQLFSQVLLYGCSVICSSHGNRYTFFHKDLPVSGENGLTGIARQISRAFDLKLLYRRNGFLSRKK